MGIFNILLGSACWLLAALSFVGAWLIVRDGAVGLLGANGLLFLIPQGLFCAIAGYQILFRNGLQKDNGIRRGGPGLLFGFLGAVSLVNLGYSLGYSQGYARLIGFVVGTAAAAVLAQALYETFIRRQRPEASDKAPD